MHLTARVKRVRLEVRTGGLSRLKAGVSGRAGPRARGLSGRGAGGPQMLAAVDAVTSMSQWQLALFNSWSNGGGLNDTVVRGF